MQFKDDTHPDRQETIRQFHAEAKVRRAADDAAGKPGLRETTRKLDDLPDGHHVVFGVPVEKIDGGYRFADGREEIASFGAAGSLRRYYWKPESDRSEIAELVITEPEVAEPESESVPTVSVVVPRHGRFRYGERKGWAKIVTGLDESQKGGFAFLGDWLDREAFRLGRSFELPVGSLVLSYGEETGRCWWPEVGLYQVTEDGLEQIGFSEERTWASDLVPGVKKALATQKKS